MVAKKKKVRISQRQSTPTPRHTVIANQDFKICLEYHWYKTINTKSFNNQLKNGNELVDEIGYIMGKLFPTLYGEHSHIFNSGEQSFKHCHKVDLKNGRVDLYNRIIKEVDESIDFDSIKDNLWQIGIDGAIRVVGIYVENAFHPLFIDRYHQLHPNQKHNQRDIAQHRCCIN